MYITYTYIHTQTYIHTYQHTSQDFEVKHADVGVICTLHTYIHAYMHTYIHMTQDLISRTQTHETWASYVDYIHIRMYIHT
jgi:hypothetical protein